MKRTVIGCLLFLISTLGYAQTNNPSSLYEGMIIRSVDFHIQNPPADTSLIDAYRKVIATEFAISPQNQYGAILASYYTSKLEL